MACLPYDLLNIFDTWFKGSSESGVDDLEWSNANVFSILKVMRLFRLGRVARALHRDITSIEPVGWNQNWNNSRVTIP